MDQLFEKVIKNTKKGKIVSYQKVSEKELKDITGTIKKFRADKKDFKVVENHVEKTYNFNGNNYVVTSKNIK